MTGSGFQLGRAGPLRPKIFAGRAGPGRYGPRFQLGRAGPDSPAQSGPTGPARPGPKIYNPGPKKDVFEIERILFILKPMG